MYPLTTQSVVVDYKMNNWKLATIILLILNVTFVLSMIESPKEYSNIGGIEIETEVLNAMANEIQSNEFVLCDFENKCVPLKKELS